MSSISREVIATENAPGAVGAYSQAIKANGFVYISGQVPLVPGTKNFNSEDVEEQAEQVMKNLEAILKEAGSSFSRVVKTTILLADIADFAKVNAVYGKYFPVDPPARAAYAVRDLPLGAKVEIEAVALAP
ncbi:hypothetical protein ACKKBG_A14495 [Auxenochlorella protothecoides x Auxenochlorella symbiontica]